MKKFVAASGVVVSLLSAGVPAFALGAGPSNSNPPPVKVPEIDVTAGSKGIAVLIAGLFLAAEALRRRR
jgi:hypothetical protein